MLNREHLLAYLATVRPSSNDQWGHIPPRPDSLRELVADAIDRSTPLTPDQVDIAAREVLWALRDHPDLAREPTPQDMVREFHIAFSAPIDRPLIDTSAVELRLRLVTEELEEVEVALSEGDQLCIAHELADLWYITECTAVTFGLDITGFYPDHAGGLRAGWSSLILGFSFECPDQVRQALSNMVHTIREHAETWSIDIDAAFREVHRANMSRTNQDGTRSLQSNGKPLKGPGYRPPDMRCAVMTSQGGTP